MRFDPDRHHRKSQRSRRHDYSSAGAYFITLCVQQRECLLGEVAAGLMGCNAAGQMVHRWWKELPSKFPTLALDEFVVMPNHVHGILMLGAFPRKDAAPALGDVAEWLKTMTTNEYIRGVKELRWRSFPGRLWQRNYHDHVIRDLAELDRVREYIRANPARWADDAENPSSGGRVPTAAAWEVGRGQV